MSSHGVPEVLMKKVDEYVDSLAPQIQPRVTQELEVFQQKTIDSLETQVIDAFRSLFDKDGRGSSGRGDSRQLDKSAPDSYGGLSLPFADEIASLTRNFGDLTSEAGDDLREIFNITEGRDGGSRGGDENRSRGGGNDRGDSFSKGARGFLSAAIDAVQDHLDDNKGSGGGKFELDGLLGVLSNTVKEVARNPEDKARLISPDIKNKVGAKLREQHAPIAERFTKIALDHIKRWLRGNTSTRDLGDGVKGEIEDHVKDLVKGLGGLFGNKRSSGDDGSSSRGFGDGDRDRDRGDRDDRDDEGGGSGFSRVISDKLSTGLAKVHREVRLEFRKLLGGIEKQLFELLPDEIQGPLEKILGGNPFDSKLDREAGGESQRGETSRGFRDDLKAKLVNKIRGLIRKVQETLRESILGVVNGGHRKFERESWVFVQNIVEKKVQKYLPNVKITVPDDIGNEGVSVGAPTSNVNLGGGGGGGGGSGSGGRQSSPPRPSQGQGGYSSNEQHGGQSHNEQGYNRPSQHQSNQDYRSDEHRPAQQYRPEQSQDYHGNQSYQSNQGYQGNQDQGYRQDQAYRQDQGYQQDQGYRQDQGRREDHGYQQDHGYQRDQGYGRDQGHDQGYRRDQGYDRDQQHHSYGDNPRY